MSAPRPGRRAETGAGDAARLVGAALLAAATAVLGALAAWPIYQTPRLWVAAGAGAAVAFAAVLLGTRRRWGALTLVALIGVFVLLVVPLAVPRSLAGGPGALLGGLADGLAAVALGWKQLLTLTLPVGDYQTVLVPFLVTIIASVAALAALALRSTRTAPFAALPLLVPVLFGTVFGPSSISAPWRVGGFSVVAPRELALWLVACGFAAGWIAWSSGISRRAALRRGRSRGSDEVGAAESARSGAAVRRLGALQRGLVAGVVLLLALGAGALVAPLLDGGSRTVPRDRIDPEIVVREQVSPLAAYRSWKRDDAFAAELFTVSGDGALPGRLRLAVLDTYDGVDFSPGDAGSGRFTRFPSGGAVPDPVPVRVAIGAAYDGIWVPLAPPIADPPAFAGDRAAALEDAFYLNRDTGSAVAVPSGTGLRAGDAYTATMSAAPDAALGDRPASDAPLVDLEPMPQLAAWLEAQDLPATGAGATEAIRRLRDRGYLSHSLTDGAGERQWLLALAEEYPIRFVTSAGGHSLARIEQLFAQLNEQQSAAGESADDRLLVAGIGDDEQFAAAAALLGRALGFESRVVVGVRLGGEGAGVPGVPACRSSCRGEHLAAWVELRGADGAWAPLDASPQTAVPPTMLEKGEQLPEFPTQPEERDATESDPPVGSSEQESGEAEDPPVDGLAALWPVLRALGLGLLALGLLALPLCVLPFAKRLRARRRRAQTVPELRALADWDRLLDDSADAGAPVPVGGSRRDAAEALGIDGGEWIARTVDRAVYAREGISADEAYLLREAVDAELAARRAARGPWQRLRAAYSLRSLGLGRAAGSPRSRKARR